MDQQQPLVCPSHTTQYVGAVIIGILVGAGASFAYFKQAPASSENTYQAGFDAAKKRVLESQMGMMLRTSDDIRVLSGTVTAVNGNRITLHTQSANPFDDDPSLSTRTVLITSETKIVKLSQKDPKEMQAEMTAFMKNMQTIKGGTPAMPPEPFTRASATATDIAVGISLNITATENIKTAKEFTTSEIQIQSRGNI
ncbi:MAG: hypothetical protein HZB12_02175 [Candidatus Yonathbacteria bacterium]|nr:hypothetical protein [Candidatus Yonathbacteria bacterium]